MTNAAVDLILHGAQKVDVDGESRDTWIAVTGDRISDVGTGESWQLHVAEHTTVCDFAGDWVSPGLIDLHVHGGGGAAIDDGAAAALVAMASHRAHGTTRTLLSFASAPVSDLVERLAWVAELAEADPTVLGAHLEGPFLSRENCGAHSSRDLCAPDAESVNALIEAGVGVLRQITIAPELPGALDAIAAFAAVGVTPAVGHTTADLELTERAFDAGARLLTHAFNSMPGLGHRNPGPVAAAFDRPEVTLELILDGVHVDPRIAALAFALAPGRVALVTDAMAGAGEPDGEYTLGGAGVRVEGGVARLSGTEVLAGSTLTLERAVRRAVEEGHCVPSAAVAAATMTPARILGLDRAGQNLRLGALRPDFTADLVRLDADWNVRDVWVAGVRVESAGCLAESASTDPASSLHAVARN